MIDLQICPICRSDTQSVNLATRRSDLDRTSDLPVVKKSDIWSTNGVWYTNPVCSSARNKLSPCLNEILNINEVPDKEVTFWKKIMQNLRTRNHIHLGKNYQRVNCQNNCVQKPTRILPGIHKVTFCAGKGKYTHVIFYENYPQVSLRENTHEYFWFFVFIKVKPMVDSRILSIDFILLGGRENVFYLYGYG